MLMTKQQAKLRINKLRQEIEHHRYLYHVLDKQEISDAALDSLKNELEQLEGQFPDLVTPDSPTQRVGGVPLPKFTQVEHRTPMLSLQDVFDAEGLTAWQQRNQKIIAAPYQYFVELKVDGVAVALIYEDGRLVQAATRGDGQTGEDVTQNIKTIEAIPLTLRRPVRGRLEVRGEIYLLKVDFEAMNSRRQAQGQPLFANPRNIAAGSIRQLDPAMARARPLRFFAWEITSRDNIKTRAAEYARLQELGFPVPPDAQLTADLKGIFKLAVEEEKKRLKRPFLVDGLVIKINDLPVAERLGVVGKAPRGSIAYKFAAEEATTLVENIVVQVGRTGALTPVAHLRPVRVAGTTVSRATLHNADEIKRKDIRVGDTVIVRKAGDIIPEVKQALVKLRPAQTKPFKMPKKCPVCGSGVVREKDGVVIRCTNPNCFSQQRERLLQVVGQAAFDIEGLGEKIIEQLLNEGLIEQPPDLWRLTAGDLLNLEGFATRSADKLVQEIQSHKSIPLSRFLVALSIPQVGIVTAQDLAYAFRTIDNLWKAKAEELEAVEGIGDKSAPLIANFFRQKSTRDLIKQYQKVGITILKTAPAGKLFGQTFVFTGSLGEMSRAEAKQRVQALGGRVAASVGANVDIVVIGTDPGSKAKQAAKLGIKTISPRQFMSMIK